MAVDLTVSLGIAELSPSDESLDALLARADDALYFAKERGRNRCEVAGPSESRLLASMPVLDEDDRASVY